MSHPSTAQNGCSLEDCHTNLFALTDLTGIKWRKLTASAFPVDPLDDPVLVSFTRCMQSDILCAWRRVPRNNPGPLVELMCTKELWIFWYGDEPINLRSLLSTDLQGTSLLNFPNPLTPSLSFAESEQGSWDNGLYYECRSILFKALHNLIERCLLSQHFVRLGKWFVQPHGHTGPLSLAEKSNHLSIRFSFFLHGESTVCASIDVRQHPPLRTLHPSHLVVAPQTPHPGLQVILAPYGLAGTLTGVSCKDTEPSTQRMLDEWRQFYVLQETETCGQGDNRLPMMVEVVVAGVRMKYPSCFVLVSADTEADLIHMHGAPFSQSLQQSAPQQAPSAPLQSYATGPPTTSPVTPGPGSVLGSSQSGADSKAPPPLLEYNDVFEPLMEPDVGSALGHRLFEKVWQDSTITCGLHLNMRQQQQQNQVVEIGGANAEEQASWDYGDPMQKNSCMCSSCLSPNMPGKYKSDKEKAEKEKHRPHSRGPLSFHRRSAVYDEMFSHDADFQQQQSSAAPQLPSTFSTPAATASADSPHSGGAPSPLAAPQVAGSANQNNADMTMPTLSPHPPSKNAADKEPSDQHAVIASSAPANTHVGSVTPWLDSQLLKHSRPMAFKRPALPINGYDQAHTELVTESLYNFKSLNDWSVMDQPVKKIKLELEHPSRPSSNGLNPFDNPPLSHDNSPLPQSMPLDPYEFSDESSSNAGSAFANKANRRQSRDDSFSRPSPFGIKQVSINNISTSLTSESGLRPSITDLEKLFDTDESESSDADLATAPSPPGKSSDENKASCGGKSLASSNAHGSGPTPHELAKMFPTPPSLENQHNASSPPQDVSNGPMMPSGDHLDHRTMLVKEPHMPRSIPHAHVSDWSFVNRPPTACMFLGSSKYSPVELPSGRLDPLAYPLGTPDTTIYKPSWTHSQYLNVPSIDNPGSVSGGRVQDTSPANASFHGMARTPRTPMSYELHSPASNASSYLNQNMKSVDNHMHTSQLPEVHALVVNIYLSDSLLNLFKDSNFNSCPICVCNTNIKGADIGLYLPDRNNEPQFRCMCGFSAAVNRTYGYNSGLFYEDEVDITGMKHDRFDRRKASLLVLEDKEEKEKAALTGEVVPQDVMTLLQGQFSALYPSPIVLQTFHKQPSGYTAQDSINMLEISDGCEAVYAVLEVGRQAMENSNTHQPLSDPVARHHCLSKWPFFKTAAKVPVNSQDVVRMLKSLQPLLQDAIQKKRTARVWESVYTISGPLSWKDFHLLAGRGSEERSEPQPIPALTVSSEKDSLSIGHHAIKYWDKMMLEPFSHKRNVVYVVVAPDNDFLLEHVKRYFSELSAMYEQCRLGKHQPFTHRLRDGIMRIGKNAASKVSDEPVADWFKLIGNSTVASKLRLYAQVCRRLLAPFLSQELTEKGKVFDHTKPPRTHSSTKPVPHKEGDPTHDSDDRGDRPEGHEPASEHDVTGDILNSKNDADDVPALVVYMVEPFSYGQEWDDLKRLSMLGILRCYHDMIAGLPAMLRENTQLQIVPLRSLVDVHREGASQALKSLCLSVYSQSRRLLKYSIAGTSLTGFGPAASAETLLKQREAEKFAAFNLYTPPFILTRERKKLQLTETSIVEKTEKSGVLFCGYCLSEDQRWLLASCIDSCGELLETCVINVEIPNRNRRKKASARRIGLNKLWDFILGVISQTSMPWRLVVGRFGRLGHGELKGWAGLLSKKNLHLACRHLRDTCNMCNVLGPNEMPQITSACLVSMENHSSMHIMTDSVKMEERRSSSAQLHTPRDASCTHILVFPTSATAQAGSSERPTDNHMSLADDGLGDVFDIGDDEELLPGINDVFNIFGDDEKGNSPPGSPSHGMGGQAGMQHTRDGLPMESISEAQDDIGNLHQQPLAMGFYVSTAKTGPLPKWFWSAAPQREDLCPVVLKAALHIHLAKSQPGAANDEFGSSLSGGTASKDNHPLDSNFTCDVLRYVLETYNALSWLTVDVRTGDRRSCLPAHFVVLMQLYQALNTYI
ncbi:hypothetical protein CAPTEDRAFT_103103 [Capitella teleta]|uniref:Mediator of RNA polymerase II transcription subunit 13 n=1 Tax=Capitella teleta TaxID=283909 RepID=R7UN35_CAPTE|nr:hypothetical protein CAPTEDRAFT_103103 [Capitella teleta]|eukprot:ELU05357.1 hypothetical protein CAPTEDRAFT_103103 [Capitella teleta]